MQPQKFSFWLKSLAPLALGWFCLAGLPGFGSPDAHAFQQSSPSSPAEVQDSGSSPPLDRKGEVQLLLAIIEQMSRDLTASYRDSGSLHDPLAEGVVVSSFVELKKLSRTSSFGRYLAEHLMSEFQRQGYRVMELRKSVTIRVQEERGEYGLSRNPADIPAGVGSGCVLTGTYTIAGDHVLVNARLLDNRTTALLASANAAFPQDDLTRTLLADRASAGGPSRKEEFVYLKRLEPLEPIFSEEK